MKALFAVLFRSKSKHILAMYLRNPILSHLWGFFYLVKSEYMNKSYQRGISLNRNYKIYFLKSNLHLPLIKRTDLKMNHESNLKTRNIKE